MRPGDEVTKSCARCGRMTLHRAEVREDLSERDMCRALDGIITSRMLRLVCVPCSTPPAAECRQCGREISRARELCSRCSGEW